MKVRFWGTRGSIAKAGPSTVRYGGNTSCVELRSRGGTVIVLDCGTGAHALGHALVAAAGGESHGHLLIGHTHWDHIQGFPFFAPLRIAGNEWHVYGPRGAGASLHGALSGQMDYTYFPVTLEQLDATVRFHDLVEGSFEVGDVKVTAQYLNHTALTLGYRLESGGVTVVYSTNHEPHSKQWAMGLGEHLPGEDERHTQFLADADLVIHDAQYTAEEYPSKTGWGHSTIEYAIDTAIAGRVRQLALFHHDPMRDDAAMEQLEHRARERVAAGSDKLAVFAASEGRELEFGSRRRRRKAASEQGSAKAGPEISLHDKSVLVAAQGAATAKVLCDAVRADRLRLLRAVGADNALRVVRAERPSVVLIEDELDGRPAREISSAIRADNDAYCREVAVIVVTDREDPERRRLDSRAGVTDWLTLPVDEAYTRTRLRAWLLRTACRWQRAPQPPDEEDRIAALRRLAVLDTEPEERFDRHTRIAAALFRVPIALISLVDTDRQWYKSRVGIEATETPRDRAFCAHTILGDDVLQVPDTLHDPRFAENPLVTGEPRVRFYAGAPLTLGDGTRVGTLCVVDSHPRNLSTEQVALLRDMARLVVRELEDDGDSSGSVSVAGTGADADDVRGG